MIKVEKIICEEGKTDIEKIDALHKGITSGEEIIFSNDDNEQKAFMEMYKKCDAKKLVDLIVEGKALNILFSVEQEKKAEGGVYTSHAQNVRGINIVEKDYQGTSDFGLNHSYQANAKKLLEDLD